ncbi:superoxide dismutase family protein [Aequorivita echinoideorum]|uniref:Superoxide dismutase [Cu-Zn] n=1 Tax=Aequorivita echinoideorum TaxID=1549647 RepID=A0ABS5S5I5_9FLAO|nr:superoxide dismutase family protein [Aequorivita echinoideorum]MBT0608471.1 superoxide dismutase family protein [Aequorivita echinoideorum]
MKRLSLLCTFFAMTVFVGCKNEKKDMDENMNSSDTTEMNMQEETIKANVLSVPLESKSGSTAKGEVVFTEKDGTVMMEAKLSGLKPGSHAIHLHEKADCSADDGSSAGGHWNPTNEKHGKWGDSEGYHKGDIGNFEADENGNGSVAMQTDEWCIGCGDASKDITGKGVIVHEGTDDFVSQPSGDAGSRVSCGGIIKR